MNSNNKQESVAGGDTATIHCSLFTIHCCQTEAGAVNSNNKQESVAEGDTATIHYSLFTIHSSRLVHFSISRVILARVRRLRMAEEMSRKLSSTAGSMPSSSRVCLQPMSA